MIRKIFKTFSFFLIFSLFSNGFSQEVVNPVEGAFSNPQILVLDLPEGCNAYFSFEKDDPLTNGIAYDGPVPIEMTGQISINVAFVFEDGKSLKKTVRYFVSDAKTLEESDITDFVSKVSGGIVDYVAGDVFSIPAGLKYEFGDLDGSFENGSDVLISSSAVYSRFVPCTVTDGNRTWRFILRVIGSSNGVFSRKDVPFEINDFNTIVLKDRSFIYKIDDEWWKPVADPVKIDSSKSHMISWQSIDYSNENPVKFFVLPPEPKINSEVNEYGALKLDFESGDGFKMGILDGKNESLALYDEIVFDTFKGDDFTGNAEIGFFYDSVLVGKRSFAFSVNRKRPEAPSMLSSSEDIFSREKVDVQLESKGKNKIFVMVEGPVIFPEGTNDFSTVIFDVSSSGWNEYKNKKITLSPVTDGAAAYRVTAFSKDSNGNESDRVSRNFVIDQCNFYIDGTLNNPTKFQNGTKEKPFATFDQLQKYLTSSRFLKVNVKGSVFLPDSKIVFDTNCQFDGFDDARFVFSPNTRIEVKNASFACQNILFALSKDAEKNGLSLSKSSFMNIDHGVLDLKGCALSASFSKSGTVFNSDNSVINLNECQVTCLSNDYASILSAVNSKISSNKCHFASVSNTSVLFSATGGLFELKGSECIITGNLGRVAELFDTHSTLKGNVFSAELVSSTGKNKAVYTDSKNYTVLDEDNSSSGF